MLEPNGLGAWWFPACLRNWLTAKSALFFDEAAWVKHDVGYARGYPVRSLCDLKFLQAMLRDSSQHHRAALAASLSLFFWVCVRIGGRASYQQDVSKMAWRDFFAELMTPSDFKNDAYGELTNQLSHKHLGVYLSVYACLAYSWIAGEMPYRPYVLFVLGAGYALIEIKQRWKPGDSGFDWLMVMFGVVAPLACLTEIQPPTDARYIDLRLDRYMLAFIPPIGLLILAFRVWKRIPTGNP